MDRNIPKVYDPQLVESKWYSHWEKKGYFKPFGDGKAEKYSIVMPPPNVTGSLHVGHALDTTWQDILIRYKRQQNVDCLWVPGTDHAGIATQRVVQETLAQEGITRHDLGREKFVEKIWEWKDTYGDTIANQIRRLGASCDWSRERFTLDEGCSLAVREVFVGLYEKGFIYRGNYIVNWCPDCGTTLSDIEVEHEDQNGKLYHVAYALTNGEGEIVVATTRPETILGDVAVAVHPEDVRYSHLIGETCIIPIINRHIPIIADDYVDQEFGSGAVKVTPAHDPNDFDIGQRHGLTNLNVMNLDATMNEQAGPYAGMDRYQCRKALLADMKQAGALRNVENHHHAVGQCSRCDTTVEPILSRQWFIKMKPLAQAPIEAVEKGAMEIVPQRFTKTYLRWLDEIRDWCISRQIWWGHNIPAWYCECGEVIVSRTDPTACPSCRGSNLQQDPDVLDTWFSSALWPFSAQGWPQVDVDDMPYYPTTTLITGYDILFFWVVRMQIMGLEFTQQVPFKTTLLHGLIRDNQGRKMSKSLGNGIDPMEAIETYGADTLRFTLVTGNTPGNDLRFHQERMDASRNFANKIWNASRFVLMNLEGYVYEEVPFNDLETADRWIFSLTNKLARDVTRAVDRFEFGEATRLIYDFLWGTYCDWYIEMVKPRLYDQESTTKVAAQYTLTTVLSEALRLLHPFMPFITEEIWQALPLEGETIMIGGWPMYDPAQVDEGSVAQIELIMIAIRAIRNIRQEADVKLGHKISVHVAAETKSMATVFAQNQIYLKNLAGIGDLTITVGTEDLPDHCMTAVVTGATLFLPLADLVDIPKERARLEKELLSLQAEVKRAEGKLKNEKFVANAPRELVEQEKNKLEDYQSKLIAVQRRLAEVAQLDVH